MLNQFLHSLKRIDQFGVSFQPKLKYSLKEQRTVFGGLLSLLLYVYDLTQWGSGQLLPRITTIQSRADSQTFHFDEDVLVFSLLQSEQINPFDPQALILVPLVVPFNNYQVPAEANLFDPNKLTINGTTVTIKNLSLSYGNENVEQIIGFVECSKAILPEGLQCANDSARNKFFGQKRNSLVINTFISQFNTDERQLEEINNEFTIALLSNSTYYQTTTFKIQESSVDTGILLESIENFEYATDYEVISQQIDQSYFRKEFSLNAVVIFKLTLSKLRLFQSIQYSKISEVLADAGSIASTLLVFAFLALSVNGYLLDSQSLNEIIQIYYPDYKKYEIKKSIFGRVKQVKYEGKLQNVQFFQEYQRQLISVAEKKLTTLNQIYEISRLQFLLSGLLQQKQLFQNVHQQHIKVKRFDIEKQDDSSNQIIPIANFQKYPSSNFNGSLHKLCVVDFQQETIPYEAPVDNSQFSDEDFEILVCPKEL